MENIGHKQELKVWGVLKRNHENYGNRNDNDREDWKKFSEMKNIPYFAGRKGSLQGKNIWTGEKGTHQETEVTGAKMFWWE